MSVVSPAWPPPLRGRSISICSTWEWMGLQQPKAKCCFLMFPELINYLVLIWADINCVPNSPMEDVLKGTNAGLHLSLMIQASEVLR